MRIAITNPYCWPQVRRGSERLLNDLSHWLAARGHEVTVISSSPAGPTVEQDGDVRRLLMAQREPLGWRNRWLNSFHLFAMQVRGTLLRNEFDAVFCLNYHDAHGALLARRAGARFRLVYMMTGIAIRRMFRSTPLDGVMFQAVVSGADEVISLSRFAQQAMRDNYGRDSVLLCAPTDMTPYLVQPKPPPDGRLDILFVADMNEPRKGALLLARAFSQVKARYAHATLAYSGQATEATMQAIRAAVPPDVAAAITFHGVGGVGDLPSLYAGATVFVNPAVWEAQGMVLAEALATGTPVVACDHGGPPDIVSDPRIGRLFAPGDIGVSASNADGLAAAIIDAAALARDPATESLCREHARQFSFDRLGPGYEALFARGTDIACTGNEACRMKQAVKIA
jgi:phosphatidylinositol alpha-mannosyltransferase